MRLINIFLILAIVSMLFVAGCSKSAPTVDSDANVVTDSGTGSSAVPSTPESQAEIVIDSTLVAENDSVTLGSLI